jgi:uncharacterized protein
MSTMIEYKIMFVGPMGAGKTTAIRALSDEVSISTDVKSYDQSESAKEQTTVGFDYGRILLGEGLSVRLVGTPGQERFSFLWPSLALGAKGAIVLLDVTRPNPVADLDLYLDKFSLLINQGLAVICLSKFEARKHDEIRQRVLAKLKDRALMIPLLDADVRDADQTRMVLETLLMQIELYDDVYATESSTAN